MKTECIYVDENHQERILYIDELVTIEYSNDEIHYMNNDSRLFREVRRASREHRLFCTCKPARVCRRRPRAEPQNPPVKSHPANPINPGLQTPPNHTARTL